MIRVAHLLDDFGMGGVTRALTLFDEPALARIASSTVMPISPDARIAPSIEADLVVDHMALSWKRLAFLSSLRARNPGLRIVHVEHSYTRNFEFSNVRAKTRFRMMLKLAASILDTIICVSSAQRDWLVNIVGICDTKVTVIYPWTDQKDLLSIPPIRQEFGQPIKLLAYGRYAPVKNFAELITAMRYLPVDLAELTVFGDGPELRLLQALAADLPNVHVFGPSNAPGDYLAQCDAVVIPSQYEAFGLVATEARMAGRAILVANVDGLPEQAGHGGMITPMRTAPEIAEAIRKLSQCDLAMMGAAGRRSVRSQSAEILLRWCKLIKGEQPDQDTINPGLMGEQAEGAIV
jgi:glycosyltransferase involved in cell wall biosynthesis